MSQPDEQAPSTLEQIADDNASGKKPILSFDELDALLAALPRTSKDKPKTVKVVAGRVQPTVVRSWHPLAVTDLFEVQHCRLCDGVTTHFAGRMLKEESNTFAIRHRRISHLSPEAREDLELTALAYTSEMINTLVPICRDCSQEVRFANSAFDALTKTDPQGQLF